MSNEITVQDISRRLAEHAESICRELLPKGRKDGQQWRVGSVRGEAGNSLGGAQPGSSILEAGAAGSWQRRRSAVWKGLGGFDP